MKQGPLRNQNCNYNSLGMSFPTVSASPHGLEIQATLSKMNALCSLLTAKSVTNITWFLKCKKNPIRTQVCVGSRELTNVLYLDP